MSDETLGPGNHTRVRRMPELANYDAVVIYDILDEARFCHVAAIVHGQAVTVPTLHAREGSTLYLHASQSNAFMKAVFSSASAFVSVTIYDGLRLARSGFESSIAYRSAVVVGPAIQVTDAIEKRRVLDMFVDAILPGRAPEVRPLSARELNLTLVVRVEINEASAKLSHGPTQDDEDDMALPIWSGTIPARLVFGAPEPSSDGAMKDGNVPLPESVERLYRDQG
jgi:nitroimidazol reductase NimA-like FMN-containing flavoprotein (pyridoxamine 5'-phosphate oxidase superfamily)